MPPEMQQFISNQLLIIRSGDCADRSPDFVSYIGTTIGPLVNSGLVLDAARHRRITLMLLTMRYVLPIWEYNFSNNRSPHFFLDAVQQFLAGNIDLEVATDSGSELVHWIDSNFDIYQGTPVLNVAFSIYAGLKALEAAGGLRGDSPPYSAETEANVAISFAAQAYALDDKLEPITEVARWCKFWEWWLAEAVPAAWNVMP